MLRSAIDGPYALLLVLQILVVAGLLLALIWMLIYRQREEQKPAENMMPPQKEMSSEPMKQPLHTEVSVEPTTTLTGDAIDLTPATLGHETDPQQNAPTSKESETDQHELNLKIGFLESKLLEYEIVQEEIANLSLLKLENEKLREEIVKLKKNLTSLPNTKVEMADAAIDAELNQILNQLEALTANTP